MSRFTTIFVSGLVAAALSATPAVAASASSSWLGTPALGPAFPDDYPYVGNPVQTVGRDGMSTLVWNDAGGALKMVRIAPNGKYKKSVDVMTTPGSVANSPSIATNRSGSGAISWLEGRDRGGSIHLRLRRFSSKGVLAGTTQEISSPVDGSIDPPSVSIAGDGYITLAWSETSSGQPARVKVVRLDPTDKVVMTVANLCRSDSGNCLTPKVVTTEAGVSTLVWSEALSGEGPKLRTNQINAADLVVFNDGFGLPLSKALTAALKSSGSFKHIELVGAGSGSSFASWLSDEPKEPQSTVAARHISAAGVPAGTSADALLSPSDSERRGGPELAVSPSGAAVVAWVDGVGSDHAKVTYRRFSSAGTRASVSFVVANSSGNEEVGVSLASSGNATLVWRNTNNEVRQVVSPKNDVFGRSSVVSAATGTNSAGPWVASGRDGTVFAHWLHTPAGVGKARQFVTQVTAVAPTLTSLKFPSRFKSRQRIGQVKINSSKYGTAVVTIAPASKKVKFRSRVTRIAVPSGSTTLKFNTTGLVRGKYTVTVQLLDYAGLKATKSAKLLVTS